MQSLLRNPGFAQTVNEALASVSCSCVIAPHASAKARNRELRMDCKSNLRFGPRLGEPSETRQSGRQSETRAGVIPVCLDRPPEPGDRLFLLAKVKLGEAGEQTP